MVPMHSAKPESAGSSVDNLSNGGRSSVEEGSSEAVIRRDPRNGQAFFGRAQVRYARGEYESALDDVDRARRLGYQTAEVYRLRGRCHGKLFLYDDVADDFSRVLEFSPDDPEAILERANAFNNLGCYDEALADYEHALGLGLASGALFLCRAGIWQDLGETEKAAADLRESRAYPAEVLPDPNWNHFRAHFWAGHGQHDVALKFFADAIHLEPDSVRHYGCRANLLLDLEREEEAEADLCKIQRIQVGEDELTMPENKTLIYPLVQEHFAEAPLDQINVTVRKWPYRAAADLQKAFERLDQADYVIKRFHATQQGAQHCGQPGAYEFAQNYARDRRNPLFAVPPQYQEIDIGEEEPVRAVKGGLWLLQAGDTPLIALLNPDYDGMLKVQVAVVNGPNGLKVTHDFYHHLEEAMRQSACYRGKVLSLEQREMYSGQGLGIMVHRIRKVARDEVILPRQTLDLVDRNVMQFVSHRPRLSALGLAVKKGLLFYGPPGNGKTHTIHYLTSSLPGHTTFLISAEQVVNLSDYITLARLLQPSMVVMEDVDLIARDRQEMRTPGEEIMLNKLLNEMDGLRQDAEILFILTTNRPSALEEALAARPGRVDQAIEFPLPDLDGRTKLTRLYALGIAVEEEAGRLALERTENVSAAFIKELMRRAIQFALARSVAEVRIEKADLEKALEELLVAGGSLNRKLLGAFDKGADAFAR